jgi:hypothetical protein
MYNLWTMSTYKMSFGVLAFAAIFTVTPVLAQSQAAAPEIPIEEVIRKFAEKEKEFKTARENYAFRQEVRIQELGRSDRVDGEYQTKTDISFDEKGKRTERVTYAPASTLRRLQLTPQDMQDLESIQPFVLTSDEIGLYNLKYGGKEKIDEITCYVFDVSPKKIEKNRRYFEGRIWVDDLDLQIVKTYGKAVPDLHSKDGENLFPKFETYREQIDEYWFPTYTRIADTLNFSDGPLKMRGTIRYTDYKKFQTSVKLRFGGEVTDGKAPPPSEPEKELAPALDPRFKK